MARAKTTDVVARRLRLTKNGAIAQLVERVLCKHEVVGSIPSGSTSPSRRSGASGVQKSLVEGCRAEAQGADAHRLSRNHHRDHEGNIRNSQDVPIGAWRA